MSLNLQDYILITEPLLTPRQCRDVIAVTEGCTWRTVDQSPIRYRTCTTFPISMASAEKWEVPPIGIDKVKQTDALLLVATRSALQDYHKKFPLSRTSADAGFDILRYETGQYIGVHVDDMAPRYLTMSIGLNDDYEGGEFRFWESAIYRLPQGCAIVFPPTFQYPHEILPVTSGTRYSMITWFS